MKKKRLVIFDFHEKCSKSRFHNVKILIDDIEKDLEEQGYFELQGDKVGNKQTSVVRTNCMDCLDRTNVVQTMVARRFLKVQLVKSGIMNEKETIESHKDFDYFLRNGLLLFIYYLLFIIYYLLFIIYYLLFIIYYLLFLFKFLNFKI